MKTTNKSIHRDFLSMNKVSRLVKSFVKNRPCEMPMHSRIRAYIGDHRPSKSEGARAAMRSLVKKTSILARKKLYEKIQTAKFKYTLLL